MKNNLELIIVNADVISLMLCLNLSTCIFCIGLFGIVWNKRNFIIMLLCIELMFFAVGLNFIFFSIYTNTIVGQLFALFIVTTAAAETAIGLSLLVLAYRLIYKVNYDSLVILRG